MKAISRVDRTIYILLVAVIGASIFYLELEPFRFRVPVGRPGALRVLLDSWAGPLLPVNFALNVVAYVPLAFCATLSLRVPRDILGGVVIIVLCGAALSISFELAQYFIPGRFTSAADVYANTLGVLLGAIATRLFGGPTGCPG